MNGTIQNRDSFLGQIANRLGRERITKVEKPQWKYNPQADVFKGASKDELLEILVEQCKNIHTKVVISDTKQLADSLKKVVQDFGGGSIVTTKDERYNEYGLGNLLNEEWPKSDVDLHIWDYTLGDENVKKAEAANVGITISDITLAESGTAVLFSSKDKGRSISFLPANSIVIVPKSSIVPRMTQAAQQIEEKIKNGEHIASCINFITGPSNSADIEMVLIVGVHGPIKATYIIVEDI